MLAMASVAMPALAQREDDWAARRAERAEQHQQRTEQVPAANAPAPIPPREERSPGEARGGWQQREASPPPQAAQAPQAPAPERVFRGGGWNRGDEGARSAPQGVDPAQIARWRERQEERRAQAAGDGSAPATRWNDHVRQAPASGYNQPPVQSQSAPVVRYGTPDGQRWNGQRDVRTNGQWQGQRDGRTSGQWQGQRDGRTSGQWQGQSQARQWDRQRDGQRWSNDWRRDGRYDWQRYRTQNRAVFRVGRYYDPFGYGYRPVSVGFRLYAGYYQSNSWLNDPWEYRLPPVYGPYRWVRYYDDAVLVDIYSGEVVDVIRNFFW